MRISILTFSLFLLASCSLREEPKAGRNVEIDTNTQTVVVTGSLIQPVR